MLYKTSVFSKYFIERFPQRCTKFPNFSFRKNGGGGIMEGKNWVLPPIFLTPPPSLFWFAKAHAISRQNWIKLGTFKSRSAGQGIWGRVQWAQPQVVLLQLMTPARRKTLERQRGRSLCVSCWVTRSALPTLQLRAALHGFKIPWHDCTSELVPPVSESELRFREPL